MRRKQKVLLSKIIISSVLFVVAYLLPYENEVWKLVFFAIPYLIVGYRVLWSAIRNIIRGQLFDEQFLMALATLGAFGIKEYPEAVAVMLFYQIGELFQGIAVGKSRKSISELMDIRPDFANVLRGRKEIKVSPEEVSIGETIIIKPGEKIPLDGEIIDGFTTVNTSALTGESLPSDKELGDNVISGCVNLTGVIKVKVKSEFGESTVAKILDLVENSSAKKARTESFITRFAKYYTPCVVMGALFLALIPPIFFAQDFNKWLERSLIFLVVSCPCALVISVPLSFFGGIGGASRKGILIKGANYLENLSKVKTVVFDKTGTLTHGNFAVSAIHPDKMSEEKLLDVTALAESYSNHPIANSIVKAHGGHIDKSRIGSISEISGLGIKAVIDGKKVYVGNSKLMEKIGAKWHECHKSGTVVHIAIEREYQGHIVISDTIKSDAKEAIAQLKNNGITKTVMLTGDIKSVGEAVGKELGIDEIHTELLPADKVVAVEKLLRENSVLAFVGDGINDAPVLSRADIGIAMGAMGSDAAIEAADIVLMDDKPSKIAKAVSISKKTMSIVKQNITFSLLVKAVVLVLGALGLANMWIAVFADVGVMILAIINAMRTLK